MVRTRFHKSRMDGSRLTCLMLMCAVVVWSSIGQAEGAGSISSNATKTEGQSSKPLSTLDALKKSIDAMEGLSRTLDADQNAAEQDVAARQAALADLKARFDADRPGEKQSQDFAEVTGLLQEILSKVTDARNRASTLPSAYLTLQDNLFQWRAEARGTLSGFAGAGETSLQQTAEREALARLSDLSAAYAREHRTQWTLLAQRYGELLRPANALRHALKQQIPDADKAKLNGVSKMAYEHLVLDFRSSSLIVRHYVETVLTRVQDTVSRMGADAWFFYEVLRATFILLILSLVCVFAVRFLEARRNRVRSWVLRRTSSAAIARYLEPLVAFIQCALTPAGILCVAFLAGWLFQNVGAKDELDNVRALALWYAGYAVSQLAGIRIVESLVRHHQGMNTAIRLKIHRTVRWLGQLAWGAAFALVVSTSFFQVVMVTIILQRIIAIWAIGVLIRVVLQWEAEIESGYVSTFPAGRLVQRFQGQEKTRTRIVFVFIAMWSLVFHGALAIGRDLLLEFRHGRKALSYLFRYRQSRSESKAPHVTKREDLPPTVQEMFNGLPTQKQGLLLERDGVLDDALNLFDHFPAKGNAVLVTGERGVGKTTCLFQIEQAIKKRSARPCRVIQWEPTSRLYTASEIYRHLWEAAQPDGAPTDDHGKDQETIDIADEEAWIAKLVAEDESLPVVFIDGMEWFFLRAVDGGHVVHALNRLIQASRGRIMWVVSVSEYAFQYLQSAHQVSKSFRSVVHLKPWSEDEVRGLILRRLAHSGAEITVEDFLAKGIDADEEDVHVVRSQEGYIRLLWDVTEGNPRVAQHFWMESIYLNEAGKLVVSLPKHPSAAGLAALHPAEVFLMRSIVEHRALTPEDASVTQNISLGDAEHWLARGLDAGWYDRDPETGAVGLRVHYWETVTRFLRRKHLLPTTIGWMSP